MGSDELTNFGMIIEALFYKMKLITLLTIAFLFQLAVSASAQTSSADNGFIDRSDSSEVYADISTKTDGVDFNKWEADFDRSLEEHQNKCKGKNCQFKNKQAFDPSWDL